MTDEPDDDDKRQPQRKPRQSKKPPSRYANAPYKNGKGKPPTEHQFKTGGKGGPGRPKGSRNKTDFDTVFDERIKIGEDRLGRPIWRSARRVGNMQLRKMVMEGNFAAIKLMKEHDLKLAAIKAREGEAPPTAAEIRKRLEEEEEKQRLTSSIMHVLEIAANIRHHGIEIELDGKWGYAPWAIAALGDYREKHGFSREPGPGERWDPYLPAPMKRIGEKK